MNKRAARTEPVTRELYQRVVKEAEQWRKLSDTLLAKLTVQLEHAPIPHVALPARKKSPISDVIKQESGGDPRLAGYLRKRARQLRSEGKAPADIASELQRWSSTEQTEH